LKANFKAYICNPNLGGSLAQLVQSICLTSRGSAVRTRQLPQKPLYEAFFMLKNAKKYLEIVLRAESGL
jgi:hypothetical protein